MTTYEFKCDTCGNFLTDYPIGSAPDHDTCAGCNQDCERIFSVSFTSVMHEHWDTTTQSPISSKVGFADKLKQQSEDAEIRTGIPHNYEPIDLDQV